MKCYYSYTVAVGVTNISSSNSIITLPKFNENISDLYLEFYSKGTTNTKLKIGIIEEVYGMSDFVLIDSVELGDWAVSTIMFKDYEGSGFITIVYDGVYNEKIGNAYIDQLKVESLGDCKAPANIFAENITDNSALLKWTPISENDTLWRIQVSFFDAEFNSYLMDDQTDFIIDTIVQGTSLLLEGLTKQTTYYYYIRPVCADGEGPRFPTSKKIRTACGLVSLPYLESFDNYDVMLRQTPECWECYSGLGEGYPAVTSAASYKGRSEERRVGNEYRL